MSNETYLNEFLFLHFVMNKAAVYVVGVAGAIAATIMPADISYAQRAISPPAPAAGAPEPPIKFGEGRTLTYKIENERPIPRLRGIDDHGKITLSKNGGFKIGGVLGGIEFDHYHEHGADGRVHLDMLTLTKGGHRVQFYDRPPQSKLTDLAVVNGVAVDLGSSDFYETKGPTQLWKNLSLYDRLRSLFRDWIEKLNVGKIKAEAERLKTPPAKSRESLDEFVKKTN